MDGWSWHGGYEGLSTYAGVGVPIGTPTPISGNAQINMQSGDAFVTVGAPLTGFADFAEVEIYFEGPVVFEAVKPTHTGIAQDTFVTAQSTIYVYDHSNLQSSYHLTVDFQNSGLVNSAVFGVYIDPGSYLNGVDDDITDDVWYDVPIDITRSVDYVNQIPLQTPANTNIPLRKSA